MSKLLTITETATWLSERDNFLIITHKRPDGDTLGSGGALAMALQTQGKTAYLLHNKETTQRYERFVKKLWTPDGFTPKHIITVDTASVDLFPENASAYNERIDLCIDHHPSNKEYAEFLCLEAHQASCGEVVYDILTEMKVTINTDIADLLYIAISTDTGCFAYSNTTSNSLLTASKLIDSGANNIEINKCLFRTKTQSRIKLEGMITSTMEFFFDGSVAIAIITREMMDKTKSTEDDIDDIAAIPTSVEGVLVGITIRELTSPQDCKISVRSSAPYNANELCMHFGGGGHTRASGASVEKTANEIKDELLIVLEDMVERNTNSR